MSCPFHDVKGFMFKIPPMASQLRRGQITNHKTINIYILCCRLSRSDEPRGEPSLIGLSRGENASRREPRSKLHKKNFAPQRGSVYLSIAVQSYRVSSSLAKKGKKVPVNFYLFFSDQFWHQLLEGNVFSEADCLKIPRSVSKTSNIKLSISL